MSRRLRLTLRQKMLLVLILPVSLLAGALSALYLQQGTRELDAALQARGKAMISFLAPAAEYVVVSGNRSALDALMGQVLAQEGVIGVAVFDRTGEALASAGLAGRLQEVRVWPALDAVSIHRASGRIGFAHGVSSLPVVVEDFPPADRDDAAPVAELIGWVYVELGTASMEAHKRRLVLIVAGLAVALVLMTTALALRLAHSVAEPVAQLVDAVRRMAGGDLDARVRAQSTNEELNALELGFNSMAEAIAGSQRTLQARIEEATVLLAHQARHDPLTGLPNRRAFEEAIQAAVSAHRRSGDDATLCFIDLDHFKEVNDSCGHAAGDKLLRAVARLIRGHLRAEDDIFRIGGDEFAVILRSCSGDDARRIAESLCAAVAAYEFSWAERVFRIGASIGLARIAGEGLDAAALMQAADQACYEVKRNGRGGVVESVPAAAG